MDETKSGERASPREVIAARLSDWFPIGSPENDLHDAGSIMDALDAAGFVIVPKVKEITDEEVETIRERIARFFAEQKKTIKNCAAWSGIIAHDAELLLRKIDQLRTAMRDPS